MSSLALLVISALQLSATFQNHTYTEDDEYYELPRFWTNVGFCPAGEINHKSLTNTLLSEEVQMNLRQIGSLPQGAITHLRVHWLLELVEFVSYTQSGVPIYDFTQLDAFITNLQEYNMQPTIEFMCNPGGVFIQNPNRNAFLWENFVYQVVHRYLNIYGIKSVQNWRFETWNEPDILNYNKLNFTFPTFLDYMFALRRGLTSASQRFSKNLRLSLHGPAGLFKKESHHPLCWQTLQYCNTALAKCPLDVLTYHRKGNGHVTELLESSSALIKTIHTEFPNLRKLPLANDEADPIVTWSKPQDFHADVRYAWLLTNIVLQHWSAKLRNEEFKLLSYISHDNAFLSYHPYEFTQRTLLAHFRMNNSEHVHSQFIQKPVYAALALLSRLAALASDVELLPSVDNGSFRVQLLKTTNGNDVPLQLTYLLMPTDNSSMSIQNINFHKKLPFELCKMENFAFAVDLMAAQLTDPYYIWQQNGSPAYPNARLRAKMRRVQVPRLEDYGRLAKPELHISVQNVSAPFLLLIRVCSNLVAAAKAPYSLTITQITLGEVFINWHEDAQTAICLKTYELWFQFNSTENWMFISKTWHIPVPSFQYAPENHIVTGFYKVRSQNLFDEYSEFSEAVEYYELI